MLFAICRKLGQHSTLDRNWGSVHIARLSYHATPQAAALPNRCHAAFGFGKIQGLAIKRAAERQSLCHGGVSARRAIAGRLHMRKAAPSLRRQVSTMPRFFVVHEAEYARELVDRNSASSVVWLAARSRLLHGGVDRNRRALLSVDIDHRRLLHGGVDRNAMIGLHLRDAACRPTQ